MLNFSINFHFGELRAFFVSKVVALDCCFDDLNWNFEQNCPLNAASNSNKFDAKQLSLEVKYRHQLNR